MNYEDYYDGMHAKWRRCCNKRESDYYDGMHAKWRRTMVCWRFDGDGKEFLI